MTVVLHQLANNTNERDLYLADRKSYVSGLSLSKKEKAALLHLKDDEMVKMGIHPFLSFMARLHIERAEKKEE